MTISIQMVVFILLIHFLGDFALQTSEQATNKSSSNYFLFMHVATYSAVWFIAMYGMTGIWQLSFCFAWATFGMHYITDYITSRLSKKFFEAKDYHNGFVVVGFDQVLHLMQLVFTYVSLSQVRWW
jgi:hypothetical protein